MRTIQDSNLEIWEAYASAGEHGFPEHATIVFHCLSDRTRRARTVRREGNRAVVEQEIAKLPDEALTRLLSDAREVK